MTWHAGDMEGTPRVVDAGDVGVWLSGLLVSRLSCFVGDVGIVSGGGGYLWAGWWNGALVVEVVGMKEEAASQGVTRVTLDQRSDADCDPSVIARTRVTLDKHPNACAHDHAKFVVYIACTVL